MMANLLLRVASLMALALLGACSARNASGSGSTSTPEQAARAFLQRITTNGVDAAYATAAPQMYRTVGPQAFRAMVVSFGLDKYQSATFADYVPSRDGTTLLRGAINEQGALSTPIGVRLIANQGAWQVISLELEQVGSRRVGEGAADPGIVYGTKFVSAATLAAVCRPIVAPARVSICAHALPLQAGASTLCLGRQSYQEVAVTATISNADAATGAMTISCRISS